MPNITTENKYSPGYSPYFNFEQNVDILAWRKWFENNWHQCFYYIAAYIILLIGGQNFMKSRKAYDLRCLLVLWNLILCIYSLLGSIRVWPELSYVLREFGYTYSVCDSSHLNFRVTVCWNLFFILSKVPELLDTAFIIFRKQKLIFLHWFHHAMTVFFTWYIGSEPLSVSRWYTAMNFVVHFIMYGYFTLKALRIRIPRYISMLITSIQIVQMVLGAICTTWSYTMLKWYNQCDVTESKIFAAMCGYIFYLLLFINFFHNTYIVSSCKQKTT